MYFEVFSATYSFLFGLNCHYIYMYIYIYIYMNLIVPDLISYKDVMVDAAIATLQSTHFIYQF